MQEKIITECQLFLLWWDLILTSIIYMSTKIICHCFDRISLHLGASWHKVFLSEELPPFVVSVLLLRSSRVGPLQVSLIWQFFLVSSLSRCLPVELFLWEINMAPTLMTVEKQICLFSQALGQGNGWVPVKLDFLKFICWVFFYFLIISWPEFFRLRKPIDWINKQTVST